MPRSRPFELLDIRRTILVDVVSTGGYARGIIAGVGRFCREREHVRLNHNTAEWELIADAGKVDGVIAFMHSADTNDRATRFHCPVVNVSSIAHPVPFPTVTADNVAIGALAADHLMSQGYSHFACHMERRYYFSRMRAEGFCKRLEAIDSACDIFDTDPAVLGRRSPTDIRRATADWLLRLGKPIGLFTHSDNRAVTLTEICEDVGLAIPEEVGLIGVDDDQLLLMTASPSLSTIDPAADVIGYHAAEVLFDILDGNPPPTRPILIKPRGCVQRQSTEPAFLDDELLAKAVQFIRQHATEPIRVSNILDVVPLSRRSLERRFIQRLGRSPAQEIRRVQMDRAKWLLLESDQKPAAIARAVGYTSYSNFALSFRREEGMTPGQYVQSFRKR